MQGLGVNGLSVYQHDVGLLKQCGDCYRVVHLRTVRLAGYEERDGKGKKNSANNTHKLAQSISRSRTAVYELAMCNPWEYFVTLTVSAEKCDRRVLNEYKKKLSKWLNNYNSRRGTAIKYLLVPEQHKDGAWHIHGLIHGLPESHMRQFTLEERLPTNMRDKMRAGRQFFNWSAYADAFGYVSMERVHDNARCAKYITKYVTEQYKDTTIKPNDHLYYCSKGLNRATLIFRGDVRREFAPDFENDYVKVKEYDTLEDALQVFCDEEMEAIHGTETSERRGELLLRQET